MCCGCREVVKSGWQVVRPMDGFVLSTLNYDARSTTHHFFFAGGGLLVNEMDVHVILFKSY